MHIKDTNPYRILMIEDNQGDIELVSDMLQDHMQQTLITKASSFKETLAALDAKPGGFDVILLDLTLPDKSGETLVNEILELAMQCPVIILTGFADIEFSIRSISHGVTDYILKDDLTASLLYKSIIYAIERKRNLQQLTESEKRYSDLFHLSPQPMCLYDISSFTFKKVNKATIALFGYNAEEMVALSIFDLLVPEDRLKIRNLFEGKERKIHETYEGAYRMQKKSGEIIEVETFSTPLLINGGLSVFLVARDVTEKNQHEHKITKAIIKTQEDERYEIGGELHDNVCQILAASTLYLGMLKKSLPENALPYFDQCGDNLKLASEEIRNLSHRLAPAFFKESSLEEAFEMLLKNVNVEKKYKTSLKFDSLVEEHGVSMELQLNLYRILQEQLKNILKYAHGNFIEVDIKVSDNRLQMRISDNGVGMDMAAAKRGIGIANMRRRAELFGGKLEIESAPRQGCGVLIDIPFD